jgi:hypothetical protein
MLNAITGNNEDDRGTGPPRRLSVPGTRPGRRQVPLWRFFTHLAGAGPPPGKSALLDHLPLAGDILPGLPPALKARLFAAFGLEILWNKPGQQATVFAEITENTLQAIPGITNLGQDGYHDTSTNPDGTDPGQPAPIWDLTNTNRGGTLSHSCHTRTVRGGTAGQHLASGGLLGAGHVTLV